MPVVAEQSLTCAAECFVDSEEAARRDTKALTLIPRPVFCSAIQFVMECAQSQLPALGLWKRWAPALGLLEVSAETIVYCCLQAVSEAGLADAAC